MNFSFRLSYSFLIRFATFVLVIGAFSASAQLQDYIKIQFYLKYGSEYIDLKDSSFVAKNQERLQIDVLKFYLSNFRLLSKGRVVIEEENSFHLLDASSPKSLHFNLSKPDEFDELSFTLGIDSATNVAGAMGGDLDPTKGMYWSWQSGYINFKLEGKSKQCPARDNAFEFHLGGYNKPYNCWQNVSFNHTSNTYLNLELDIEKVLRQIDLSKQHHIMSPKDEAVSLSQIISSAFGINEP